MKVFRSAAVALWRSATREFRRLLRDPNLALVLFIAPLAYPLLYGAIYVNKIEVDVPIAVVDLDNSEHSRALTRSVDALQGCSVTRVGKDEAEARALLETGAIHAYLLIPKGLKQGILQGTRSDVHLMVSPGRLLVLSDIGLGISQAVAVHGARITAATLARQGVPVFADPSLAQPVAFDYRVRGNAWLTYGDMILPALLGIILMQLVLIGAAAATASEWSTDGWRGYFAAARAHPLAGVAGKASMFVVVFLVFALILRFTLVPCFDVRLAGSVGALLGVLVLGFLAAAALGLFLGSFFRHRVTVFVVLGFSSYPLFMLSGYAWPAAQLPPVLRWLAWAFPTTPFLQALGMVTQSGAGWTVIQPELLALLLLSVLYILLAALRFKSIAKEVAP